MDRLKNARHVLLAGAGGGYDVFAAVPLLTALRLEITLRIEAFRERTQTRPWQELPV